jgi:hypothetical protein
MSDITLTDTSDSTSDTAADVDRLLTASRGAHERAKSARHHKRPDALALLIEARDLRVQAHQLDPEHTSPAWALEETSHAAYMAFYQQKVP